MITTNNIIERKKMYDEKWKEAINNIRTLSHHGRAIFGINIKEGH